MIRRLRKFGGVYYYEINQIFVTKQNEKFVLFGIGFRRLAKLGIIMILQKNFIAYIPIASVEYDQFMIGT